MSHKRKRASFPENFPTDRSHPFPFPNTKRWRNLWKSRGGSNFHDNCAESRFGCKRAPFWRNNGARRGPQARAPQHAGVRAKIALLFPGAICMLNAVIDIGSYDPLVSFGVGQCDGFELGAGERIIVLRWQMWVGLCLVMFFF